VTDISIAQDINIAGLVFQAGASSYDFTCAPSQHVTNSSQRLENDSGVVQNFDILAADTTEDFTSFAFDNESSAGSNTVFTAHGANVAGGASPGYTQFALKSTAGSATLINQGGVVSGAMGGEVDFFNSSQAANSSITNQAGLVSGALGGRTIFWQISGGGQALITAGGATASGAEGGSTIFQSGSSAADATLVAEAGAAGGGGGLIQFLGTAAGSTARVEVFGNGTLDISTLTTKGTTIGSLEGDGMVLLGTKTLTIGSNNLSTTFGGVIQGDGAVVENGTATLSLSGPNSYTGGTTITKGTLRVQNKKGTATGTGKVVVQTGTLSGGGKIFGAVTIGTGKGAGAFLAPSTGLKNAEQLTIRSAITFKADGTYNCKLSTAKARTDSILADGVTIESGAQFNLQASGKKELAAGMVFTLVSNTSANPIGGTFANLADGATLTVGKNQLLVNYEGGDGNDLTLTVSP
jgi:autotransporter-associated beta strand protein